MTNCNITNLAVVMIVDNLNKLKRNSWKDQRRRMAISHEAFKLGKAFKDNLITLLISAFGLVAALAWNSAVQEGISMFISAENTFYYKTISAILISIMAVFTTYILSRFKSSS